MSEVLINHINCKVVGYRKSLRIITNCNDKDTFDRVSYAYNVQFKNVNINPQKRQVIVNCVSVDDYEQVLAVIEVAKHILMMSECARAGEKQ